MLAQVQIADPASVMNRYPHQLSGGMQQRVVIAMALAAEPALLILDEPTTALDATVEAEVLDLIAALRAEFNTSVLFISHNLGVIAKMCDRVGVLYAGELVEEGPAREVFLRSAPPLHGRADPLHPAPRHAQDSTARWTRSRARCRRRGRYPRLRLRRPLRAGRGPLPLGGAAAVRGGRPPGPQLACHFHERAQTLPRATAAEREAIPGERPDRGGVLINAADVSKTFHMDGETIHGLVGVEHRAPGRGDARARRRVRQRQDDAGAGAARPDRARRGLEITLDGQALAEPRVSGRASRRRRCRSSSRTPTRR